MLTEDRDPLGLPIPWYWILCLCISGLSVICGIIACICLDRHMKKKLLAYLNEHQELQSVTSEDEVKAVSAKKLSSELEKVNKAQNKNTDAATNGKSQPFRKQKSKQAPVEPISYTSLMGNYFEQDASLEIDSEADKSSVESTKELRKPPVRLEPMEVRPVPPKEVPVKQLKKRGQGLSSTNPKPVMLAALAATTFDSMKSGNAEYEEMRTTNTSTKMDTNLDAEVAETTLTEVVSAGSSSPAISMSPVSNRKRFIEVSESPVSQRKNVIEVSEKAKTDDVDTRTVKSCVEVDESKGFVSGNVNRGYSPGSEDNQRRNAASEDDYTDFSSSDDDETDGKKK